VNWWDGELGTVNWDGASVFSPLLINHPCRECPVIRSVSAVPTPQLGSDVVLPTEAEFSSTRELRKGCTFFIALVGVLSGLNGLLLLIARKPRE